MKGRLKLLPWPILQANAHPRKNYERRTCGAFVWIPGRGLRITAGCHGHKHFYYASICPFKSAFDPNDSHVIKKRRTLFFSNRPALFAELTAAMARETNSGGMWCKFHKAGNKS